MMEATEVQRAHKIFEALDLADGFIRNASGHLRLRCHYEPGTDEHDVLTTEISENLTLAKVAIAQAQSAEDGS